MGRNAWGNSFDEVSLMEFELGSRVTEQLLSENSPWGDRAIVNRVPTETGTTIREERDELKTLVGRFVILEGEPHKAFRVIEILNSKVVEVLAEQVYGEGLLLGGRPEKNYVAVPASMVKDHGEVVYCGPVCSIQHRTQEQQLCDIAEKKLEAKKALALFPTIQSPTIIGDKDGV